jgi:hypothetical protein
VGILVLFNGRLRCGRCLLLRGLSSLGLRCWSDLCAVVVAKAVVKGVELVTECGSDLFIISFLLFSFNLSFGSFGLFLLLQLFSFLLGDALKDLSIVSEALVDESVQLTVRAAASDDVGRTGRQPGVMLGKVFNPVHVVELSGTLRRNIVHQAVNSGEFYN